MTTIAIPTLSIGEFICTEQTTLKIEVASGDRNLHYARISSRPTRWNRQRAFDTRLEGPLYYLNEAGHTAMHGPNGARLLDLDVRRGGATIISAWDTSQRFELCEKENWALSNERGSLKARCRTRPSHNFLHSNHVIEIQCGGRLYTAIETSDLVQIPHPLRTAEQVKGYVYMFFDLPKGTDIALLGLCTIAVKQMDHIHNPFSNHQWPARHGWSAMRLNIDG